MIDSISQCRDLRILFHVHFCEIDKVVIKLLYKLVTKMRAVVFNCQKKVFEYFDLIFRVDFNSFEASQLQAHCFGV